ncbi:hypothetical protein VTK73DRAFT_3265 [Phialemonium thermophilum]|uniref:Uncharacterized protein n=1 Tax=Phialemonium thermophilum TaxID=223376 RepID=A0ABR3Y7J5_9PEZI
MSDSESVDYLQTEFDPWSLTVPRLRSILVTHNIQYPATAKKQQLVDLFNEHVVPQSKKYLAARARARRTSKGIVDAGSRETPGSDEDHGWMPPPTLSRARSPKKTSRSSKRASEDLGPDAVAAHAPAASTRKRQSRSASAQVIGASDTDTGTDADARSARRSRRTTPAVKLESVEDDGFFKPSPEADNVFTRDNPFQSGSSPVVPPNSSSSRRKTAGPESLRPKTPTMGRRRTEGPADDGADPRLSSTFEIPLKSLVRTPRRSVEPAIGAEAEVDAGEEFTPEAQLELAQEEARDRARGIVRRQNAQPPNRRTNLATPIWVLLITLLAAYAAWYRQEKIAVGYCGLGKPTTPIISDNLQLPDWAVALVEPQCEPCPAHAYCYEDFSVRCEPDFVLKPHPLSFGGLVPLPPTCEPDGEKVRRVKAVADRTVEELRERRAKFECGEPVNGQGEQLESPAIQEQELKETISQRRSKRMNAEEFEDLWAAAIGEVKAREEVEVIVEDPTGDTGGFPTTRLSSTSLARLPIICAVRRSVKLALARHRLSIGGLIVAVLSALYARARYRAHRATAAQIPGLVNLVLERLAAQKELAFEEGDEDAFLFLPNLRDDVLRATHSLAERERIWQRVRAVVEQNSNVRTGQREGRNGEVGRAWEWIGPSSVGAFEGGTRRRKSGRVSWGPDVKGEGEQPEADTKSGLLHQRWEESRPIY